MTSLASLLDELGVLVADGAMGTSLMAFDRGGSGPPERWNVDAPDRILGIHVAFADAGADILLTNTFGGTSLRLAHHGMEAGVVGELNRAGAGLARRAAAGAGRPVLVAGSMGPTGMLMEPLGALSPGRARDAFRAQAELLADSGVDLLWVETMSAVDELSAAVAAAAATGLPVVATMSFDTRGRTMMGTAPADLASWWRELEPRTAAIGANCGIGPEETVAAAAAISGTAPDAVVVAKGNCGLPVLDADGGVVYPVGPEGMEAYAREAMAAGARIVGACCGSTPAHITEIARTVAASRT